jgi:2',3'-cyclic-nucleotide 2'-phosphodiesterase (5'-nucleotidase family)
MQKQKLVFWQILIIILIVGNLKSADFKILFSANINGNLENCNCGKFPLGGIGRIKSFIDEFKKYNKNCIVIDGGDFFNSYPYPKLNHAMLNSLELINYDLILPGDQEFVEGIEFFNIVRGKLRNKILISNLSNQKDIKKRFRFNDKDVEIYAYLSPSSFRFIRKPKNIALTTFSLLQNSINHNACNIVIYHGPLEEAELLAKKYQWIDLILLAHEQTLNTNQSAPVQIVGCGQDSEYISVVVAEQLNGIWKFNINQKPIEPTIQEDSKIVQIINTYHAQIKN